MQATTLQQFSSAAARQRSNLKGWATRNYVEERDAAAAVDAAEGSLVASVKDVER